MDDIPELIDYIHRRGCKSEQVARRLTLLCLAATAGGETVGVPSTGSTQAFVSIEASLPIKGSVTVNYRSLGFTVMSDGGRVEMRVT